MRYAVREKIFHIGDDFWVTDEQGNKVFLVDGKVLRIRQTLELKDASGAKVAEVLAPKLAPPGYVTVISCVPTVNLEVLKVAVLPTPLAFFCNTAVPKVAEPSKKVTVAAKPYKPKKASRP